MNFKFWKTKRIEISYGKTWNLGNYNSEKIQLSISCDVGPNENIPDIIDKEFRYLKIKAHRLHNLEIKENGTN